MAIVAPVMVTATRGQTVSVTITVPADTTGWTVSSSLRSHQGATAVATKTTASGIVNTPGGSSTLVITWTTADTTQPPGAWIWDLKRTDAGFEYDIVDPSTFFIADDGGGDYPTLTNLSALMSWVGLSTISDADAKFYLMAMSAAETAIRSLCGRDPSDGFLYKSRTEYPLCSFTDKIILREPPVASITSVYYSPLRTWDATTLLVPDTDYYLDLDGTNGQSSAGLLVRRNGVWAGGYRRGAAGGLPLLSASPVPERFAQVTYLGGFPTCPLDLQLAVIEVVQDRRQARTRGIGFQSQSSEGYQYSLMDFQSEAAKLLSVQQIVRKYRRGSSFAF